MDDLQYQKALQEALAGKFRGQTELVSKVAPRYPSSVEREYMRFVREYMAICDKVIRSYMPELKRSLGYYGPARFDEAPRSPDEVIAAAQREIEEKLLSYDARNKLEYIAGLNQKLSIAEWNRVLQRTLGISVFEDYYSGDFFSQIIDTWVSDNVALITTQPQSILGEMREIIQQSQASGQRVETIAREINEAYGMGQRHAQLIARDQTAKLNSAITRKQQEDAGVTEYVWTATKSTNTRDCHRELHGQKFSYDNPPEMWYKTKRGKKYTGRRCNPGEDYQCGCKARSVFNGVPKIPVRSIDWQAVDQKYQNRLEAFKNK